MPRPPWKPESQPVDNDSGTDKPALVKYAAKRFQHQGREHEFTPDNEPAANLHEHPHRREALQHRARHPAQRERRRRPPSGPWRLAGGRLRRVVREAATASAGTQGLPGSSAEYGGVLE